jgi:hypothetical protein
VNWKEWNRSDDVSNRNGLYIDANGDKEWYLNGKLHREDGPAVVYSPVEWDDGVFTYLPSFWYLNDERLKVIPQHVLINYMKANDLTLAHLLTDPDTLVRSSAEQCNWSDFL